MWDWRHEEHGMVNRDKGMVGVGGDLEKNDLVVGVGVGCEYEGVSVLFF